MALPCAQEVDLTGAREFLTREGAEEALAPLLAAGATHTRVRLSTKSFGADAAQVAAGALANVKDSLRDADFSDVIAGETRHCAAVSSRSSRT